MCTSDCGTIMEREINWQEGIPVSIGECQHLKVKCHVVRDVGENLANQFHTTPGLGQVGAEASPRLSSNFLSRPNTLYPTVPSYATAVEQPIELVFARLKLLCKSAVGKIVRTRNLEKGKK